MSKTTDESKGFKFEPMSRDEIFAHIKSKGMEKCEVEYSGGNDEGGVDTVNLCRTVNGALVTEPLEHPQVESMPWKSGRVGEWYVREMDPDERFYYSVEAPVYEKYGGFATEGSIRGTITFDAVTGFIRDHGSQQDWVSYEEDV